LWAEVVVNARQVTKSVAIAEIALPRVGHGVHITPSIAEVFFGGFLVDNPENLADEKTV
jgi:hypothetical protein